LIYIVFPDICNVRHTECKKADNTYYTMHTLFRHCLNCIVIILLQLRYYIIRYRKNNIFVQSSVSQPFYHRHPPHATSCIAVQWTIGLETLLYTAIRYGKRFTNCNRFVSLKSRDGPAAARSVSRDACSSYRVRKARRYLHRHRLWFDIITVNRNYIMYPHSNYIHIQIIDTYYNVTSD